MKEVQYLDFPSSLTRSVAESSFHHATLDPQRTRHRYRNPDLTNGIMYKYTMALTVSSLKVFCAQQHSYNGIYN